MAHQHFYSRVPARVSMYNKYDGFDTFAHSQSLTREFIEKELSLVYADKLSKNDTPLVRRGEINPVYYHCCVKSGKLVQGCITYLPLDYTGERSAYFTHTLVFDDDECKQLLINNNSCVFNPEIFKKDISEFNITSPQSSPNNNFPTIDYINKPISEIQGTYKRFDQDVIKEFIGSILLSLCKKGKNVYFKMDTDDLQASTEAVKFVSEIMSILPYTLKQNLSFVSYINDPTQYPSFKLKCLSSLAPEVSIDKGVFFDFKIKLYTGINHEEIVINKTLINFFYSLLENNDLRLEFLDFMTNAIDNIPSLQNLNLKVLSDLVFLFCGSCGHYREEVIIPTDDSLLEFFTVYEKYRLVLSDEYKMRAYHTLNRYPTHHLGIPKAIFTKIIKLYPTDIKEAKQTAMDIVLELIHTDTMREKLFSFIQSNYYDEDDETRMKINEDLCRVFYGGFMQPQILKFFDANFDNEPIITQDQILDKLLLSIRTNTIQSRIIEFIDKHYDIFTLSQKQSFYNTFFEMLVECDELTKALVRIVNIHGNKEQGELLSYIETSLSKLLEADYRKKENLMLPILTKDSGLCLDIVIKLVFKDWYQRKIYNHFIELLKTKNATDKTKTILNILYLVPNMEQVVVEKLLSSVKQMYINDYNDNTNLYTWLDLYQLVEETQKEKNNIVLNYIKNEEITNGIIYRLYDAFNSSLNSDGLNIVKQFANKNKKVRDCNSYQYIKAYKEMIGNIRINVINKAFNIYDTFPNDKALRKAMASHIENVVIDRKKQSPIETIYFDICVNHLKDEKIQLDKLYIKYKDIYKRQYFTNHGANANPKKAMEESVSNTLRLIFDSCYNICITSKQLSDSICNSESKLRTCIVDFTNVYGSKTKKWVAGILQNHEANQFTNYFNKLVKETKPQSGGLFSIFKK